MTQRVVNYKYGTGNPVLPDGSIDVRDGIDNLQSLDVLMNAPEDTYNQRNGAVVKTVRGITNDFNRLLYQQEYEFNQQISDQESEFNQHIAGMAFTRVGTFESGATLDDLREVLLWDVSDGGDGHEYGWAGSFPKVVAPNSTPSSSGGVGAGAWVDRSDVTLRSELSAHGGAEAVGYSAGDPSYFSFRKVADYLKQSLWFDDFKGATDDEKWASLAAYVSTAVVTSVCVMFSARKHTFSSNPATLTKPFALIGLGAKNTILQFNDCDGVRGDLSGYGKYCQSKIAHMSIVANSANRHTGVYFKGFQTFSPHDSSLILDGVSIYGLREIDNSAPRSSEWAINIHLDDADEISISDVFIVGSENNGAYSTRTTSKGIFADTVTGLRISKSSIFLSGVGVEVTKQSEGLIISDSTIVAVTKGILLRDLVGPANNQVVTNTHINPFERGICIEPMKNDPSSVILANYFTNIFILERGDSNNKSARFIGVDAATRFSKFTNVTVWANVKATGVHEKIGFRIAHAGNILHNCHSHKMTYSMETFDVIEGYVHGVAVHDFYDEDSIIGLLSPTSTKQITGMVRSYAGAGGPWSRPVDFTDRFTLKYQNGIEYFDVNAGVISLKSPSGDVTNFRHVPNTSTDNTPGATIIGVGGTTVANQGSWILRAELTKFSGSQSPEVANTGTVGTSGRPWSGGFTQTAFTVTSDERAKTVPEEITDAMLDAAAEVEWVLFQYLDRVEEKGTDGARWHFGAIAQRFVEAFERHGLDPYHFAFICYDEWDAVAEVIGEDGETISEAVEAGSRYGIRYEQAIILKQKQIERDHKRQLDALVARIEALEHK